MNLIVALVIGAFALALVEARHKGMSAGFSSGVSAGAPPVNYAPELNSPPQLMMGSGAIVDSVALQGGQMAANALKNVSSAIPIIGGIAASIIGAFTAAHELRKKQAISENQAVDAFITKGFTPGMIRVANAYNGGKISARDAVSVLDVLWHHYWAEVTPVIQPGRNGCQGGAAIDYSPGHPPTANTPAATKRNCSGSWGAACCLGAEYIGSGIGRLQKAILTVDQNGGSQTVPMYPITPNKYSNFAIAGYRITVQRPR